MQFLKEDIDDDFNEINESIPAATNLYGMHEDPGPRWIAPLRRLSLFKESKHPGVAFFHLLFKTLAILVYLLNAMFTDLFGNFVIVCVIIILLLAFDFWTVKNVSGRLLVGLRWWNYVREDGSTEWIFESTEDMSEIGATDRRLFWTGLYTPAVLWSFFLLWKLITLKLEWLIVIVTALSLSFANIVGYTKCSKEARQRIEKFTEGNVAQNLVGAIGVSNIINGLGSIMQANQRQGAASVPREQQTMSV